MSNDPFSDARFDQVVCACGCGTPFLTKVVRTGNRLSPQKLYVNVQHRDRAKRRRERAQVSTILGRPVAARAPVSTFDTPNFSPSAALDAILAHQTEEDLQRQVRLEAQQRSDELLTRLGYVPSGQPLPPAQLPAPEPPTPDYKPSLNGTIPMPPREPPRPDFDKIMQTKPARRPDFDAIYAHARSSVLDRYLTDSAYPDEEPDWDNGSPTPEPKS